MSKIPCQARLKPQTLGVLQLLYLYLSLMHFIDVLVMTSIAPQF